MNWLAAFAAKLVELLVTKLVSWLKRVWDKYARRNRIKKEAEESVQPLKDAKTKEEIDSATDNALDRF